MLTNKRALILSALAMLLTLKVGAQNSLGDPVLYEDFGFGGVYSPVGPPLPAGNTTMAPGGSDRCPLPGRYMILNTSSNCYGDTFSTINFDHSGTNPYGYLMMINGDDKPVVYYTNKISGSKFCPGTKYQLAAFFKNINTQMPRPAGYVDPSISFTVKTANGAVLANEVIGPFTSDTFTQYHIDFVSPADGSDVIISLNNASLTGTIGNDFAMDDITVKPYGPQIEAGIGSSTGITKTTQCLDDRPARYILKSHVYTYTNPQYQWQLNYNKTGWKPLTGETNADLNLAIDFLAPASGTYQYRVGVISGPGASLNCQTFSEPIVITVQKNPEFKLPPITYVCEGQALSIHADGGTDYLWTYPDGRTSTSHFLDVTPNVTAADEGTYTVTVSTIGCSKTSSTQVKVLPAFNASVDNENPVICKGLSVQLNVNGGNSYKWFKDEDSPATGLDHDDVKNPVASPTETTKYSVFVSNEGCIQQRIVTVTVIQPPTANAGTDRTMTEGETITLQGAVTGTSPRYFWTPADYMDDPTSLTPKISPPEDITYTLHVESAENCGVSYEDEMHVRVFKKLVVPSTFTPNSDGVNDTWRVANLSTYPQSVLTIYTREGGEVFRTVGDAKQWNGILNGKALPPGTYYYVIDLKNNLPKKSGWVLLMK
ncbi:gliding motility-associated C-terminal domain-containing protein [Mucilaginibacter lutimaris]|uniref:Gliding motility-associated C-terminal domain-containing protein n=1 Tax=Mucilaginibacter lutimaris TaxID=931629 RepID=A0ABW2ZAI1_9SPHI